MEEERFVSSKYIGEFFISRKSLKDAVREELDNAGVEGLCVKDIVKIFREKKGIELPADQVYTILMELSQEGYVIPCKKEFT